jgi:radical SAM superfamily enzyme YgiQ (UPF0313 family)
VKIAFHNPPWWIRPKGSLWVAGLRAGSRWPFTTEVASWPDNFKPFGYLPSPLFMQYATNYCQRECHGAEVHFRDSIALRESYATYFTAVKAGHYDFIFIETATPSWDHDAKVIAEIHRLCHDTKIVVCGPITATRGVEILEHHPVHACAVGEYERASVRIVNGESGIIPLDLLSVEQMNAAPPPFMSEEYAHRYWDANPKWQQWPHAQVWSSRGCSYRCLFCSYPSTMTGLDKDGLGKRPVRFYTADYMEAFLTEWKERYGFKCIYDDSDTMNFGDAHTLAISEAYRKVGLPWLAMTRADTVKHETWQAMRDCGCKGVKIGFESGNQETVDKIIRKNLNLKEAKETAIFIRKLGMSVHGTFMVGLPGETKEQQQQTVDFIAELYRDGALDTHQLSGAAVLEGTPLSTLATVGHLAKYSGAKIDANYLPMVDGNVKASMLAKELQRSPS